MMKKYKLIEIAYLDTGPGLKPGAGIWITSTDEGEIASLFEELKKRISSAALELRWKALDSGLTLRGRITKLGNRDAEAAWLLLTILGEQGWEPFSVLKTGPGSDEDWYHYHYRQEIVD